MQDLEHAAEICAGPVAAAHIISMSLAYISMSLICYTIRKYHTKSYFCFVHCTDVQTR